MGRAQLHLHAGKIAEGVTFIDTAIDKGIFITEDHALWGVGSDGVGGIIFGTSLAAKPNLLAHNVASASISREAMAYLNTSGNLFVVGELGSHLPDRGRVDSPTSIDADVEDVELTDTNIYYRKKVKTWTRDVFVQTDGYARSLSLDVASVVPWIALSDADWLSLPDGYMEKSVGTLSIQLELNDSGKQRRASINLSGIEIVVAQDPLPDDYVLLPSEPLEARASGETLSVPVAAGGEWAAAESSDWLELVAPAAGVGDGFLSIEIAANPFSYDREAVVTVGDSELSVRQLGSLAGVYFSIESATTSSAESLAGDSVAGYAGLWIDETEGTGKLIGACAGADPGGFAYDVVAIDSDTLEVDLGGGETVLLMRDAATGIFAGELPCLGWTEFGKRVVSYPAEYAGYHEIDAGTGDGAVIFALVGSDGEAIIVSASLDTPFAAMGRVLESGEVVADAADSPANSMKFASAGSGVSVILTELGSHGAKVGPSAATAVVEVRSVGAWEVVEAFDWIAADIAAGVGDGLVSLSVDANPGPRLRTATVEIGGRAFALRQHGDVQGLELPFDEWLLAYFLESEIDAMPPTAAAADPDLDALGNRGEWLLGLDPTDFASRLSLSVAPGGDGLIVEAWPIPEGVVASLQWSPDLTAWTSLDAAPFRLQDDRLRFELDQTDGFLKATIAEDEP